MAAEVGQRFSGWSNSDLPYNDQCTEDDTVHQMVVDHGSVSFGRFAAESLSWEKRSVFAHNSRQEEISKFTLPGLVAQKKAFFEEYYKRKAQKVTHHTEATLEEKSDYNTLGHSRLEDKSHAVISEHPVASALTSSFEPPTGVSSSDEKKCRDPHGLGYSTFNPLFSQITGSQGIQQEEGSGTGEKQYVAGEFQCTTQTSKHNGFNHKTLGRKVLAPKHVVSTDYGESNVAASRIFLPIASLPSKGLNVGFEKQEPRNCAAVMNGSTKGDKNQSSSLIHIPRVDLRRNSENRNSRDSKDSFHQRIEMQLRALSDRMSADKAAAASKLASRQSSNRSSYQNPDRVSTSSRSASYQNTDRGFTPSKSAAQASHKSFEEVRSAATLPHTNIYCKRSHVSHVASSNSTVAEKLAARSSIVSSSSQTNAKPFQTTQVTSKRAASLTSVSSGSQNKRKQLSRPAALDENNRSRGLARISAPTSARSSYDSIRPYKTAKAPKLSNGKSVAKTEIVQKSTYGSHAVGGRNVVPKRAENSSEQSRKVISSRAGSLTSSTRTSSKRNNLTSGVSLSKSKPRQERPRWR